MECFTSLENFLCFKELPSKKKSFISEETVTQQYTKLMQGKESNIILKVKNGPAYFMETMIREIFLPWNRNFTHYNDLICMLVISS